MVESQETCANGVTLLRGQQTRSLSSTKLIRKEMYLI
jgi:hypothetical protein